MTRTHRDMRRHIRDTAWYNTTVSYTAAVHGITLEALRWRRLKMGATLMTGTQPKYRLKSTMVSVLGDETKMGDYVRPDGGLHFPELQEVHENNQIRVRIDENIIDPILKAVIPETHMSSFMLGQPLGACVVAYHWCKGSEDYLADLIGGWCDWGEDDTRRQFEELIRGVRDIQGWKGAVNVVIHRRMGMDGDVFPVLFLWPVSGRDAQEPLFTSVLDGWYDTQLSALYDTHPLSPNTGEYNFIPTDPRLETQVARTVV